jgi:hypothetical protein
LVPPGICLEEVVVQQQQEEEVWMNKVEVVKEVPVEGDG